MYYLDHFAAYTVLIPLLNSQDFLYKIDFFYFEKDNARVHQRAINCIADYFCNCIYKLCHNIAWLNKRPQLLAVGEKSWLTDLTYTFVIQPPLDLKN